MSMVRRQSEKQRISRNTAGFTFIEMLMALLILVLVTGIVATSVPAAFQAHVAAVDAANAQTILSTTTSKLRDELAYATDVDIDVTTGEVHHYLSGNGYWTSIVPSDDRRSLVKLIHTGELNSLTEDEIQPLLPDAAITEHLEVAFDDDGGIFYDNGVFEVRGLEVRHSADHQKVLSIADLADGTYKVRALGIQR